MPESTSIVTRPQTLKTNRRDQILLKAKASMMIHGSHANSSTYSKEYFVCLLYKGFARHWRHERSKRHGMHFVGLRHCLAIFPPRKNGKMTQKCLFDIFIGDPL